MYTNGVHVFRLISDLKDNIGPEPQRRQECGISAVSLCEVHQKPGYAERSRDRLIADLMVRRRRTRPERVSSNKHLISVVKFSGLTQEQNR